MQSQRARRSGRGPPAEEAPVVRCTRAWTNLSDQLDETTESIKRVTPRTDILLPIFVSSVLVALLSFVSVTTVLWTNSPGGAPAAAFFARILAWLAVVGAAGVMGAVFFFLYVHDTKK